MIQGRNLGVGNSTEFENYEPTTTDPGWWLTIVTVAICLALNLILPVLVRIGNARTRRKNFIKTAAVQCTTSSKQQRPTKNVTDDCDREQEENSSEQSLVEKICEIVDYDDRAKQLLALFLPYWLQSIISGVLSMIDVAIVGYYIGVQEANVKIVVDTLMSITDTLVYGFSAGGCDLLYVPIY